MGPPLSAIEERSLTSEERSPSGSPTAEQRKIDAAIEKIQASIVESEKHVSHSKTTVSRTWKAQVKAQKQVLENLNATRSKLRDDQKFNHQLQQLRSETIQDCQKTLEHKDLPRIQETQTKIEELVALLKMNKMPELRKWETLLGIFKELDIINQKNTTTLLLTQNVGDAEEAVKQIDDAIEVLTTERNSLQEQLRSNETSLSQKQKESKSSKDRKKKADDALKSHQREAKQEADRVWTKLHRELTSFSKTRRKISFF
jgi:chromosome segregation ATPase